MTRSSLYAGLSAVLLLPALAAAAPRLAAHGEGGRALIFEDNGKWTAEVGGIREALTLPVGGKLERVVERRDGWIAAGTVASPIGSELLFLEKVGGVVRRISPPAAPVGPMRSRPQLLTDGDRTLGSAWLEGDESRRNAIRFSPWLGSGFGAPVEVAPPGPGEQLALAGTVLADGRMLLVWAGDDGTDDEIWAVVGRDRSWSAPVRVGGDNRVPDILPTVVASGEGALVAWSRLDGDEYRVAMASFDGNTFGAARWAGPAGTLYPSFENVTGEPALLFRDARGSEWVLAELNPKGAPGRQARAAGRGDERPVVSGDRTAVVWNFGARSAVSEWR
jgi:hypothetical protein